LYSLDLPFIPFRFSSEQSAIVSLTFKDLSRFLRAHFVNGSAKVSALYSLPNFLRVFYQHFQKIGPENQFLLFEEQRLIFQADGKDRVEMYTNLIAVILKEFFEELPAISQQRAAKIGRHRLTTKVF
jgi:hypothetical protein